MAISTSISRFGDFFKRHGFRATIRRVATGIRRALFSNRQVVFWCDLSRQIAPPIELPNAVTVERKRSAAEIDPQELAQIVNIWNPELAQRNMYERFDKGASLWLIKFKGQLAGCGWTLQGKAIAPYYFPLADDDIQFFDFHVFPKYRGRAIDWFLMTHALREVAEDGALRAFAEAAEWNQVSLSSITSTPFRRLGSVRKLTIAGHVIVCWDDNNVGEEEARTWRKDRGLSVIEH